MSELGGYGPTIIATLWTDTAIAIVFVSMRLWTRIGINHVVGWDDYLIGLSAVMLIPYAGATTVAALHGLGRHSDDLTLNEFFEATQAVMIGQTFGLIGAATSKASVAAFLLRITITNWHKWVLYLVLLSVSVTCFLCALFDFIRCMPIESVWNPTIPGHCWLSAQEFTTLSVVVGAVSAAADFILAILPWFILWNLQMRKKEKIQIAYSMSLGLFAGVCGVIRTCTVEAIASGTDYSYETVRLILWSSTELTVTILCATLPTLRPLYKQVLGRCSSLKDRRRNYKLGEISSPNNEPLPFGSNTTNAKSLVMVGSRSTDDRSDKSILGGRADRGIVCTDVVDVTFEERRGTYTSDKSSSPSNRSVQIWDGQVWELV